MSSNNPKNLRPIVKRKVNGRRANFGIPVYWKPKFNTPAGKDGWRVVTRQKTWTAICKRRYSTTVKKGKKNNKKVVTDIIPEIDDLVEEEL